MQQLQLVTAQIRSQQQQQKLQQQQQYIADNTKLENNSNIKLPTDNYLDSQLIALVCLRQQQQKQQDELLQRQQEHNRINEVLVNEENTSAELILNKNDSRNIITTKPLSLLESQQLLLQYLNVLKQQHTSPAAKAQGVNSMQLSPQQNVEVDAKLAVEFNSTNKLKAQQSNFAKKINSTSTLLSTSNMLCTSSKIIEDSDEENQTQKFSLDFQRQLQVAQLREKKAIAAATVSPTNPTGTSSSNSPSDKQRVPYSHESFHTIIKFLMDFNLVSL